MKSSTLIASYLWKDTWKRWFEQPSSPLARLFVTGQNLLTITGYSGFDPDVNSQGGDPRYGQIDIGAYPRARVWNFGVSATF